MFHYKVGSHASVSAAEASLSRTIKVWIEDCLAKNGQSAPGDYPAQAVYTCGWIPWLKCHLEHPATKWLYLLRDTIDDHFTRSDKWYHGYWRLHEAGQGVEHFLFFLGGLWELDREEPITIEMVVDAAEHLGNWSEDVPAWFDWDSGLFRSVYLGSNGPQQEEDFPFNLPMHLRGLDLALLAYRMTGQVQYLDLALAGAARWAEAITCADEYPLALDAKCGLSRLPKRQAGRYKEFLAPGAANGNDEVKALAFLRAGGVQLLLKLWQYSRETHFIEAVERTLDLLIREITDSAANALVAAIRYYRNHSGRLRYDDAVLQATEYLFPYFIESLNLEHTETVAGNGQPESVYWRENSQARQHNPLLLGLAAEISGNERLATRALDLGEAYLQLAWMAFPVGRENPYRARSVAAVVRGGAQDNGAGLVNELWEPLQKRFCADTFARRETHSRRPFPLRLAR